MKHTIVVRDVDRLSKKLIAEVKCELDIPDTAQAVHEKYKANDIASGFMKQLIIRASDAGRGVIKSKEFKGGKYKITDVIQAIQNRFKDASFDYSFKTKGAPLDPVEKLTKGLLSAFGITDIAQASEAQRKAIEGAIKLIK